MPVVVAPREVDRHEERGALGLGVAQHHRPEVQLGGALGGDRHADHPGGVVQEEGDGLGRGELGGDDEVALVLAVLVVDDHHDLALRHGGDGVGDGGERHQPILSVSRRPAQSRLNPAMSGHGVTRSGYRRRKRRRRKGRGPCRARSHGPWHHDGDAANGGVLALLRARGGGPGGSGRSGPTGGGDAPRHAGVPRRRLDDARDGLRRQRRPVDRGGVVLAHLRRRQLPPGAGAVVPRPRRHPTVGGADHAAVRRAARPAWWW